MTPPNKINIDPEKLKAAMTKAGTMKGAAKILGVGRKVVERAVREFNVAGISIKKKAAPGGLEALRNMFGKEEIMRRKTTRMQEKMNAFINTTLKSKMWMLDVDVRAALGFSSADHCMIRRDYESLLKEGTDENGRKNLIWAHPDYIEEVQDILNGTSK